MVSLIDSDNTALPPSSQPRQLSPSTMMVTPTTYNMAANIPRGGQPQATLSWYRNEDENGEPTLFKHVTKDYWRGFDLTITQFEEINDRMISEFKIEDLYKNTGGLYANRIQQGIVYEVIEKDFGAHLHKPGIPGWWAEDALKQWIRDCREWMAANPHRFAHSPSKFKRKLPSGAEDIIESEKEKKRKLSAEKRAGKVQLKPLKQCYFVVSVRDEPDRTATVSAIDLIRTGVYKDSIRGWPADIELKDLDVEKLFVIVAKKIGFSTEERLVYVADQRFEGSIESEITNEVGLRNAVEYLRGRGVFEMSLEVVSTAAMAKQVTKVGEAAKREPLVPNKPAVKATRLSKARGDNKWKGKGEGKAIEADAEIKVEPGIEDELTRAMAESNGGR